jgi:Uma2 family endonuclease
MKRVQMTSSNLETISVIPKHLIYETIDNTPFFYKGYKAKTQKTQEDIMGCSGLQAMIVSAILRFLYQNLSEARYEIVTNETGLHLNKGNNLSTDIGIYDVNVLTSDQITDKYLEVAPKIVIEVDTKAEMQNFDEAIDYYHLKTQKLLDFGVEKVIWITSKSQKVMVATDQTEWRTYSWNKEIEIIENIRFSMSTLLKQRRIKFDEQK